MCTYEVIICDSMIFSNLKGVCYKIAFTQSDTGNDVVWGKKIQNLCKGQISSYLVIGVEKKKGTLFQIWIMFLRSV